jgi:hypothetical protein
MDGWTAHLGEWERFEGRRGGGLGACEGANHVSQIVSERLAEGTREGEGGATSWAFGRAGRLASWGQSGWLQLGA